MFTVRNDIWPTRSAIAIDIYDCYICPSIVICIIANHQMSIHVSITYDMDITILLKILGCLLIHDLYIFGCCCLMNFRRRLRVMMMIYVMFDDNMGIGICWSREFVRTHFWLNLLCKIMFLIYRHRIPLICRIGVIDASMPVEHTTRTYFCTCLLECFSK